MTTYGRWGEGQHDEPECGDQFTYGRSDDKATGGTYTDTCKKPAGHQDTLHTGSTADWRHNERDGQTFDTYVRWA